MGSNDDVDLAAIINTGAMNVGFLVDALGHRAIVDFSAAKSASCPWLLSAIVRDCCFLGALRIKKPPSIVQRNSPVINPRLLKVLQPGSNKLLMGLPLFSADMPAAVRPFCQCGCCVRWKTLVSVGRWSLRPTKQSEFCVKPWISRGSIPPGTPQQSTACCA